MARQFIVQGARKDNGEESQLVIEANDAAQAEQIASIRGLFVSSVQPANVPSAPTQPTRSESPSSPAPSSFARSSGAGKFVGLAVISVIAAVVFLVLAKKVIFDYETYQGKSTREWLVLASDKDTDTRVKAVDALGHMDSRAARNAVRAAALNDYWWEVRAVALRACRDLTDEQEIRVLGEQVKDADANYAKPVTCDPFLFGVERLKTKAASLAPALRKLRDEISVKNYLGSDDKVTIELIDRSLKAIEGKQAP